MAEIIIDCFSAVIPEVLLGEMRQILFYPILNVDKYRDCFPHYLKWEFK